MDDLDDKYMYTYSEVKEMERELQNLKKVEMVLHYTQAKTEEKEQELQELKEKVESIVAYLALPKFSEETWVSKYDILRLLGRY